jgi:transcriptional regulator with XRE-family HTH domain
MGRQSSNLRLSSVNVTVETVSDVVAARVRQVRKRRDWSPADLAARCAALGAADLTENVIENIESRSQRGGTKRPRPVTVDELVALSAALNVAATHLLVPPDDYRKAYQVTSTTSEHANYVREWIRGHLPLRGADPREYFGEVPRTEYDLMHQAVSIPLPPDYQEEDSDGERQETP